MYFSIVVLVLTEALVTEVCHTLNVTVTPGPVVLATERDNLTLSCLVSQRKRSSSVLILRWFFSPLTSPTLVPPSSLPPTSPAAPGQFLIVRMGVKKMKLYGNYTRGFPQPKFHLYDDEGGNVYRLLILSVTGMDQGFYSCRVQEIRKHKNIWRASSNGTSTTQLTVFLCAVLICSLGLLSIFLFTLILICQYFHRRHRLKSYLLVKCPESSGETVTSSSSCSSSSPRAQRKDTRQKTDKRLTVTPLKPPKEPLPHTPAKTRVLKEESLTYAELELVRPRQQPPACSSLDATPSVPDTVYAQILFQEEKL
uniref:V-set and transmembrane domain containing 4a n=1 Tax=Kryptolebias marmoratus TaxID=37003 RepID=A0A3Q3GVZ1_KRYMA